MTRGEILNREELKDRIWKTKKTRHITEARLLRNDNIINFLIQYYGVAFLCFQLAPKYLQIDNNPLDWIATSCSIAVMVFSLMIGTQDYKRKAAEAKECYIALQVLEGKFSNSAITTTDLNKEYAEILQRSDNHKNIDFYLLYPFSKIQNYDAATTAYKPIETDLQCFYRHILILINCWFYLGALALVFIPVIVFNKYILGHL